MSITDFDLEGTVGTALRPKRIDLEIYQGDTFTFNLVLKGADASPLDLTGWTGIAQIKKASDNTPAEVPTLDLQFDNLNGKVVISVLDTDLLQPGDKAYKYDVQLTDTAANKRTFIGGSVTITEDISE